MEIATDVVLLCQQVLAQQVEVLAMLKALLQAAPAAPIIMQYECTMHCTSALTVFFQGLSPAQAGEVLQQVAASAVGLDPASGEAGS